MTDKEWQTVIDACYKAGKEHLRLLKIAEKEYIRRYKHNPSEVDDDYWIDSMHNCWSNPTIEDIKNNAILHNKINIL